MEQIILNGHVYLSGWLSGCVCGVRLLIFRHWEAIRFPAADKKKKETEHRHSCQADGFIFDLLPGSPGKIDWQRTAKSADIA